MERHSTKVLRSSSRESKTEVLKSLEPNALRSVRGEKSDVQDAVAREGGEGDVKGTPGKNSWNVFSAHVSREGEAPAAVEVEPTEEKKKTIRAKVARPGTRSARRPPERSAG